MSRQASLFNNQPVETLVADEFTARANAVILQGDSAETLKQLPAGTVKLIITSPPYNIGKAYEKIATLDQYLKNLTPVVDQLTRVLADDGSLCWQVGNYVEASEVFPLTFFTTPISKSAGFGCAIGSSGTSITVCTRVSVSPAGTK